jgi:CelD/BcsL family acetyltransferase involved in cellulose biosynthesis
MSIRVVDLDVLSDDRWGALIAGTSGALFSSPTWLGVLHSVYGFEFRARAIEDDGSLRGGMCYSVIDDPRGRRVVSLPFCDFNDPIVEDRSLWESLTEDIFSGDEELILRTREHPVVCGDERLTTSAVGVSHELDATQDPETALTSFATLPKRMIKRAPRDGLLTGATDSRKALRSFFDLHLGVRKYRHGLLAQPYRLFEQIAETFIDSGNGFVVGSWSGDEFVGGCVVLIHGDTAYYKFSASHPDFRKAGVSHVTLFEGFRLAHELGLATYDLGRSDLEPPGLLEFKRRFRPTERPVTMHRRDRRDGRTDELGPTLGALTELFVREDIPDDVTEQAGKLLYRYFV